MSVVDLRVNQNPDRICFVFGGQAVTWKEFSESFRKMAFALERFVSGERRRIALFVSDPKLFVYTLFAIFSAGGVAVPLPQRFDSRALARIIKGSRATLLVVDDLAVASLGDLSELGTPVLSLREILDSSGVPSTSRAMRPIDPDDEMTILYSSGTTGEPRGVVHTHRARLESARILTRAYEMDMEDKTLVSGPIYTGRALAPILATLYAGGASTIAGTANIEDFISLLERETFTTLGVVPTELSMLLARGGRCLDSLRGSKFITCGGSSLEQDVRDQIMEAFPKTFVEVYASTETELISLLPRGAPRNKRGSVGQPAHGVAVSILDEDDRPIGPGVVGEVVVDTPANLRGYEPAINADCFWTDPRNGRRSFRTGDLGLLDDDGFLWLSGRKKDMIITAGFKVYPIDIEATLLTNSDVAEAAVVGLPLPILGETPFAFVVLRAGAHGTTASDVCAWANARLSVNQRLYGVRIVGELPRNVNGKVQKTALRTLLSAPSDASR